GYSGDVHEVLSYLEESAKQHYASKVICYVRRADVDSFIAYGYVVEAIFKWYYQGVHAYVLSKYFSTERHNLQFEVEENEILLTIHQQKKESRKSLPDGFIARPATLADTQGLSEIYAKCFQVYPTPLKEVEYIQSCMQGDTLFYVVTYQGQIVSAASAEKNPREKNAELTDCATLPEFRKYGLIRNLLHLLEEEMKSIDYVSIYSLARALSFGMNKALYQEGFQYTGRLIMNCYIYDKLEDMNL